MPTGATEDKNTDAELPASKPSVDIGDKHLMGLTQELLQTLNKVGRLKKNQLAKELGWKESRVNGMMNLESQATKSIGLGEMRELVIFARKIVAKAENAELSQSLRRICDDIVMGIYTYLTIDGLSATEYAFVSHLNVDDREQDVFSKQHAGVYAIVRLDLDGDIVIAKMEIQPKSPGGRICRFTTNRSAGPVKSMAEELVDGYIYAIKDFIYTIARPRESSALRSTVLSAFSPAGTEETTDLVGLRLGVSSRDKGAFAHRIYCRRIGGPELIGKTLDSVWSGQFQPRSRKPESLEKIAEAISDIEAILRLLTEDPQPHKPWGLQMPQGEA